MSLRTFDDVRFDQVGSEPGSDPLAHSMRFMETGLAVIAIVVALLLNLGR